MRGLDFSGLYRWTGAKTISYYIGGLAAPVLNTLFYMTVLVVLFLNAPTLQNLLGEELMATFKDNILLFVAAYVGPSGRP